jgi:phospholipid transport system substrate-binding protein
MRTLRRFLSFFAVAVAMILLCWQGSALAAPPDPTEQLKPFIENIVKQLKSKEFREDTTCSQCRQIIVLASEHFDFREMSKRVMGKQWRTLSPEQRDQFVALFTKLLQYAYIGQVGDYVDRKIEFKKQRIKGTRAEVQTLLVDKDKTIPVSYIMMLKGEKWMVYDIVVEGVSLIRNYMEQIRSVLKDEKFAGLIKLLEEKISTLENQKKE